MDHLGWYVTGYINGALVRLVIRFFRATVEMPLLSVWLICPTLQVDHRFIDHTQNTLSLKLLLNGGDFFFRKGLLF